MCLKLKKKKTVLNNSNSSILKFGTFQVVIVVKSQLANAGDARDMSSIPGSGRSLGEGHGNSLQYSCLESPMDGGALAGCSPQGCTELDMTEVT